MLGNRLKLIVLILPIIFLIGFCGNVFFQRYQIDKKLLNAGGLVWKAGTKQYTTRVNQLEDGELLEIRIKIVDSDKKEIYTKTEIIDRDMFGGGFIRAVQIDQDFENEIVIWHSQAKYYLDFSEGNVIEVPFDQVPQQIKDLAQKWHNYNVMAGLEMTILFIFVFGYYVLYVFVMGFLNLFKRKKRAKERLNS